MSRLTVSLKAGSAMDVTRLGVRTSAKLVYLVVQNRLARYQYGRSPIVYIGTTERGINRIASSVATIAPAVLGAHGVNRFEVRIITCKSRQNLRTWQKLERALLLAFREMYGEVPKYNTQGKNIRETDEFTKLFSRERLRAILKRVSESATAKRATAKRATAKRATAKRATAKRATAKRNPTEV